MLTWPCCLKMVAITDVTSKALTSKCLRLKCSDESNASNRKRFLCLHTDVPLVLQKKKMLSKCEFFLLKISVLNGFLSALEVCLVNLEPAIHTYIHT